MNNTYIPPLPKNIVNWKLSSINTSKVSAMSMTAKKNYLKLD